MGSPATTHLSTDGIETMRQAGADTSNRHKEISKGGLDVNVVAC